MRWEQGTKVCSAVGWVVCCWGRVGRHAELDAVLQVTVCSPTAVHQMSCKLVRRSGTAVSEEDTTEVLLSEKQSDTWRQMDLPKGGFRGADAFVRSNCSSLQGPQVAFSQEDFVRIILPSLTELDTVLFLFTLDGEVWQAPEGLLAAPGML